MYIEHKEHGEAAPEVGEGLAEWARLLLKAAALLEERGWCQNRFQSGRAFCAIGALQFAATGKAGEGFDPPDAAFQTACTRLENGVGGGSFSHVPSWNDNPLRTKDEVVAKLRAVALGG